MRCLVRPSRALPCVALPSLAEPRQTVPRKIINLVLSCCATPGHGPSGPILPCSATPRHALAVPLCASPDPIPSCPAASYRAPEKIINPCLVLLGLALLRPAVSCEARPSPTTLDQVVLCRGDFKNYNPCVVLSCRTKLGPVKPSPAELSPAWPSCAEPCLTPLCQAVPRKS